MRLTDAPNRSTLRVPIARVEGAEDIPIPRYATPGSSGVDLHAAIGDEEKLEPGRQIRIPTGIRLALPEGMEAQVRPRSGLAFRHGIMLPNAPGTIDSDYRGEIQVLLWNTGSKTFNIRRGDRVAQLVVAPVVRVEFEESDQLESSQRGRGGFGHTGHKGIM